MTGSLPYSSYLDAIREECSRLVLLAEEAPTAAVPTCPGWDVTALVGHVTGVCDRMAANIAAGDPTERAVAAERSTTGPAELEAAAAELSSLLEQAGPERPAWNWSGEDLTAAWVARRAAHETAVHRADAELALAREPVVETELGVDGLDERVELFFGRPRRRDGGAQGGQLLPGSLCLVATDADAAWLLEPAGPTLAWHRRRRPADAVLAGPASALFLWSWDRQPISALQLTGRAEVARALVGFGP